MSDEFRRVLITHSSSLIAHHQPRQRFSERRRVFGTQVRPFGQLKALEFGVVFEMDARHAGCL